MINVMLVDDEVLALEYLKNLINWEGNGYHIVGTAVNGKKALELYEKLLPEIVISDIKMSGMDGLELARQLKEKNSDVVIILLSAYRDFAYAQKGICYGVSNYLLKHELGGDNLLAELQKVQKSLEIRNRRKKMHQKYLMNQLIYDQSAANELYIPKAGEVLFLMMVHKRSCFVSGEFVKAEWDTAEARVMEEILPQMEREGISSVAEVPVSADNWVVLCRMTHTPSRQFLDNRINQWAGQMIGLLDGTSGNLFHAICSRQIAPQEISETFRLMSRQVHQAFFWRPNSWCFLETYREEEKVLWGEQLRTLESVLYAEVGKPGDLIKEWLETLWKDRQMEALRSLLPQMNNLLLEQKRKAGMEPPMEKRTEKQIKTEKNYCVSMDELIGYYREAFETLHQYISKKENEKYSRIVAGVVSYIRKNFEKELSLELLGEEFHMNGVYLGQIFKKEVGLTVLKYQTMLRIEEAKRLLREENCTVSETARLVGYQTSQYFSQIFARKTGQKPQDYRRKR